MANAFFKGCQTPEISTMCSVYVPGFTDLSFSITCCLLKTSDCPRITNAYFLARTLFNGGLCEVVELLMSGSIIPLLIPPLLLIFVKNAKLVDWKLQRISRSSEVSRRQLA